MSSSGDAVAFRCQATTLTGARQSSDVETQRCLDDSRALLRDSFDAASGSGFEECGTGSPEERALCMAMAASSAGEEARVFHGRRGGGDWYPGLATASVSEQEMPVISKSELRASFEAALQEAGRNAGVVASVAARVWRTLGDADRAEALFLQALELAPQDSAIHASYAEFLWQCDV